MWHTTTGRLLYDPPRPGMTHGTQWWAIVTADREITRYYRWWVERRFGIRLLPPSWDAHVSVVRGETPAPAFRKLWKRHHGELVTFRYAHHVRRSGDVDLHARWADFAAWAFARPAVRARIADIVGRRIHDPAEIAAIDIELYDYLLPDMRRAFEREAGGRVADGTFWFVDVDCPRITELRTELGRPTRFAHHLTIGRLPETAVLPDPARAARRRA